MSDFEATDDPALDEWLRRDGKTARAGRKGCPHPDVLLARRSELADPRARERLEAHIATCDACARLVRGLDQLHLDEADAAVTARVLERVSAPGAGGVRWILPLAAGMLLALGAALWWRIAAPRTVAPELARTSVPAAARPAAPIAAPVVALWTIDPFPVTLAISSLDASRGASQSPAAPSRELVDALLTYEHGEYAKAAEQFTAVTSAHPEVMDAWLYLGVAHLMADHPADAIVPLQRARRDAAGERREAIDWYLAAAEQRTGQPGLARARLENLCRGSGPFRTRACDAQRALR